MRKAIVLGMALVLAVALVGCGGGGEVAATVVAGVYSDPAVDGDVAYDPVDITYTAHHASGTGGTGSVWFGIDNGAVHTPEYAGFLDFPLDGSTGGDIVPSNATIVSADIEVFVTDVSYARTVPVLLDLVDITGSPSADFNSDYLAYRSLDFFSTDKDNYVRIDVTPLMREAQRLRRPHLQLRFLLDLSVSSGLVEIDDRGTVNSTRPLLTVEYY